MTKQLFDEVIGDLPYSTVDVDRIVQREKGAAVVRRGAAATFGAIGLAGVVVATLLVGPAADREQPPLAGPAATGSATVPAESFRLVAGTTEEAAATANRLSKALDRALIKAAPGATWIDEPDVLGETPGPDGQAPKIAYRVIKRVGGRQPIFSGSEGVLANGRKGFLGLRIFPGDSQSRTGPFILTPTFPPMPGSTVKYEEYDVHIKLADGRVLSIMHGNDFGPDMAPPAQPGTPLTQEQVLAIATDIAAQVIK